MHESDVEKVVLPNINRSLNVTDPNRIEGKKQTSVDVGDVIELKYMKEKGAYKGKVVKFSRSKITRSNKRDLLLRKASSEKPSR